MALPTFTPPCNPSPGTTETHEPKVLRAEFGDGYTQATADGINHDRADLEATWEILTPDERDEMVTFFKARGGYAPFFYKFPWHAEALKWTVARWTETIVSGSYHRMTATFRQSFTMAN
ncbi:phage tail protein [Fulvimarina sp. 2208YS6-2-32]|uniref:Phage tail protein n=1 Tax=Fulvimarina uroteuthidis TaxID=3098149 RepID=A0ABU5I8L5_9HYPH|nr:phage tail protein [Fulvimarina sp. 2208YS6-2-32]MDY8111158.1 phage tail protein [Fulvimarina sp. 2208YS6-2-32]